ncbi:hypothetical protein BAUCODRAFT_444728 [Baudoinia panamericana UAMH 10762]|uniref:Uncharacterized protein n=1 Tax=Baudoinia panamericana (strain UAMH 10762) TaxID=717646 RepID=M2NE59_BAUPA|nr:uncharacterized protein BAUCODRAFT_444728 [Baudoinia panamericana UAMH 10762]EMC97235.1 hypothetical protein BAUCODRAFT_444728 [Baudoinia panamericana UAMH 10762]
MRCLDIPTDHRLRKILNCQPKLQQSSGERSDHLRILEKFGQGILRSAQASAVSVPELDFCLELARPETTGGIVVVLQHPDFSQIYSDGFAAEEARCRTLRAVKELVQFGSGGTRDTDCVSILDCMPFATDDYNGSEFHKEGQRIFLRALEAKRPDVVISCFRTETPERFLRLLQGSGIGRPPREPILSFPGKRYSFTRISVFHPGYVVNHVRTESCFRRLLALEFAKGFGIWHETWKEEAWMEKLRRQCREVAEQYSSMCLSNPSAWTIE